MPEVSAVKSGPRPLYIEPILEPVFSISINGVDAWLLGCDGGRREESCRSGRAWPWASGWGAGIGMLEESFKLQKDRQHTGHEKQREDSRVGLHGG